MPICTCFARLATLQGDSKRPLVPHFPQLHAIWSAEAAKALAATEEDDSEDETTTRAVVQKRTLTAEANYMQYKKLKVV